MVLRTVAVLSDMGSLQHVWWSRWPASSPKPEDGDLAVAAAQGVGQTPSTGLYGKPESDGRSVNRQAAVANPKMEEAVCWRTNSKR